MADITAALLRLRLSEGRLTRAYNIAQRVPNDPTVTNLFRATVRDLPVVKSNFEADFLTIAVAGESTADFDADAHAARLEDFDQRYYDTMALLESLDEKPSCHTSNTHSFSKAHVPLPKIDLPTFTGDPKQWVNFSNLFTTLISNHPDLAAVEKLSYLKSSLKGDPLSMIQALPLADANFEIAWRMLVDRFQNKKLIVSIHVESLLDAPIVTSDSPASLRKLLTVITENVAALEALEVPVKHWDLILLPILCKKLDVGLQTQWEMTLTSNSLPTLMGFTTFLQKNCQAQEAVSSRNGATHIQSQNLRSSQHVVDRKPLIGPRRQSSKSFVSNYSGQNCLCDSDTQHWLHQCPQYLTLPPKERYQVVKSRNLCLNCLQASHQSRSCPSKASCRACGVRHHTSLHFSDEPPSQNNNLLPTMPESPPVSHSMLCPPAAPPCCPSSVLLSTVLINIPSVEGGSQTVRALLDSASQSSFITEECVHRLGLVRRRTSLPVYGLSQTPVQLAKGVVDCIITPVGADTPRLALTALILPKITTSLPTAPLDISSWSHLSHLRLADPHFGVPGRVDVLIGADLFPYILCGQSIHQGEHLPAAISTVFGWALMGNVPSSGSKSSVSLFTCLPPLDHVVRQFWEIEEIPLPPPQNPDDHRCEEHFARTCRREETGRYVVTLPFKESAPTVGESRVQALHRLHSLERRLLRDPSLHVAYTSFMDDYIKQGHMSLIPESQRNAASFYIPHHAVHKHDSTTTKLRVVFNASAPDSSGLSLNDRLFTGPKLQKDVVDILLRFRFHAVAFTADIQQMYRQILISEEDRDYQRVLWRPSPHHSVCDFRLNTVTYGVSSAPYLAIRVLQQLATDESDSFRKASSVLMSDTYVDDVVSGASSVEEALELQRDLIGLTEAGGFHLRKFASNEPALVSWLPSDMIQQNAPCALDNDGEVPTVKILGLQWHAATDTFSYTVQSLSPTPTKRSILSDLARIFDPLGWLSPLVLFAKFLIQHLWTLSLDWDATPPSDVLRVWERFQAGLPVISTLTIPRFVPGCSECASLQLHGFCDSSERGYAAVVYLRVVRTDGNISIHLLIGKSKVAPIKKVSLPRLELCGALLLAKALHKVLHTLPDGLSIERVYAWTDSTVALHWISASPHCWKTFVANRVTQIQDLVPVAVWNHVSSDLNPADCASRGLFPVDLIDHSLWWSGPLWLHESPEHWPSSPPALDKLIAEEEQKAVVLHVALEECPFNELLHRFSSLKRVQRITAVCLRFGQNCRSNQRCTGPFTPVELSKALMVLIRSTQQASLRNELDRLANHQLCSPSVQKLTPFVDLHGLLRVGGRLHQSELSFDEKHPILLPKKCRLAELMVDQIHKDFLHPGPRTLQSLLLKEFWVLGARSLIRYRIRKCMKCFRTQPKPLNPLMASLPASRVREAKPFLHTGVDYGGPLSITMARIRKPRVLQAYICLFVCFSTKAVHLELASDLSTEAFIAAFRRFVARRGHCAHLYSDCGTNFVGANRRLSELQDFLTQSATSQTISDQLAVHNVSWHFNPPSAPHFGGLWEAGIKSTKSLLIRTIGSQLLTYEELYTVLTQIEVTLNSRPLCALSSDPNDLAALTPSHFLTLGPPQIIADEDVSQCDTNRLTRWALLQQIHQSFWKRWHLDYLHHLQPKEKWTQQGDSLEEGGLVLIKDPNLPPLRWRLGRVIQTYPGADGVVRVVKVRTQQGVVTRPSVKLCPLPSQ